MGAAVVTGTTAAASAAGSLAAAAYFARRILTPERGRPDDHELIAVGEDRVVLGLTADSVVPGRYGLWLDGGAGHLRFGDVLEVDGAKRRVTRRLLGVDAGVAQPGPARWNSYYYASPPDISLGLETRHVTIRGELGSLPGWVVPPPAGRSRRWAVLIHGRGRAVRRPCGLSRPCTMRG